MDIATQVKKQAKQHGLTTQMLADKLGITRQVLSSQINGNPTITTLAKIAMAIGCNVKDFFNDEQEKIICPYCGRELKVKLDKISEN